MKLLVSAVISILLTQICSGAVVPEKDLRMDQIIMGAAESHKMFDLMHLMNDNLMTIWQLDILTSMPELQQYYEERYGRRKRKATNGDENLWPNCTVYYTFSDTRGKFSEEDIAIIDEAIAEWENYTCLRFIKATTQKDRIVFQNGDGCSSRLGRRGGPQPINLSSQCRKRGVVIHEIGHAIGWIHEHARPDRDDFISIDYNKIPESRRSQYNKVPGSMIDDRDVMYDYDSIMHYSGNVYGPGTITTFDPSAQSRIGQTQGLSFRDIKLANLMYRCAEKMNCSTEACPGEGFRHTNCECVCPGPIGNPLVSCDNKTSVVPTKPPKRTGTPTTTGLDCMDLRSNCAALKTKGSCLSDLARMSIFCRETCGLCNEEAQCMDYDEACPFFASSEYCERKVIGEFFQEECPLSCGICEPVDNCLAYSGGRSTSPRNGASSAVTSLVVFLTMFCF